MGHHFHRARETAHEFPQERPTEGGSALVPGSERMTRRRSWLPRDRVPNDSNWTLRSFPKFAPADRGDSEGGRRVYDRMNGSSPRVVIETSRTTSTCSTAERQIEDVFRAYRARSSTEERPRFKSVIIFKNHGSAGASLTTVIPSSSPPRRPKRVIEEMSGCKDYFRFRDRCLFCDIIVQK